LGLLLPTIKLVTPVKRLGVQFRLAAMALALSSAQALACGFDTDCSPGSKCVKPAGRINGMCTGGQFPGNKYDKIPYSDPFDPNRTAGKTCSFSSECGPDSHCQKGLGIYGVCVRK
jgi:hypothetical protein